MMTFFEQLFRIASTALLEPMKMSEFCGELFLRE